MYLLIISFSANSRAAKSSTATSVSLSDWLGGKLKRLLVLFEFAIYRSADEEDRVLDVWKSRDAIRDLLLESLEQ